MRRVVAGLSLLFTWTSWAQSTAPTDAAAYVASVSQHMLQRTAGGTPFQVKAHFVATGTPENTGTGTYEEIWVSPEKWRKEIRLESYKLILVRKGDTTYRLTGSVNEPRAVYDVAEFILPTLCPCPATSLPHQKEELQHTKVGSIDVIRVGDGKISGGKIPLPDDARYFSADHNALLMWTRGYSAVSYTKSGMLAGQLALLDFKVAEFGKTTLDVKVDALTANPPTEETLFSVPDGAQALPKGALTLASGVIKAMCISCPQPRYPEEAKRNRIQGVVVLEATIDEQGTIRELTVVSSPDASLSQAAMEAVRTWRYSPTLLDGVPRQVITQVHVNFTIGH